MTYNITTDLSFWYLIPLLFVSLAAVYYYHKKLNKEISISKSICISLLRLFSLILISILILSPNITKNTQVLNKPLFIWAQDDSRSILNNYDSTYYKSEYKTEKRNLLKKLEQDYKIIELQFGQRVRQDSISTYRESYTNISSLLEYIKNNFDTNNLEILLASDGIYNSGNNPEYTSKNSQVKINCFQLGDTSLQKDASILDIKYNKLSFINDIAPVLVKIKAEKLENKTLHLVCKNNGRLISRKKINIKSSNFIDEIELALNIKNIGLQKYSFYLETKEQEFNKTNNKASIVIEVVDTRKKIAIITDVYHPDLGAIKESLKTNNNFEIEILYKPTKLVANKYDLIIAYKLNNSFKKHKSFFNDLKKLNIPLLLILHDKQQYKVVSKMYNKLEILNNSKGGFIKTDSKFNLFELDNNSVQYIESLEYLDHKYYFKLAKEANSISLIDKEDSYTPVFFINIENQQLGIIQGSGLWKWKQKEILKNDNSSNFNNLINNIAQYLCLNIKNESLKIDYKKTYSENESINIRAEYYNKSYQKNFDVDLELELSDGLGKSSTYSFNNNSSYNLNIENLKLGDYTFIVKVKNTKILKTGKFNINKNYIEYNQYRANKALLYKISKQTKARYFETKDFDGILDYFTLTNKAKQTISLVSKTTKILNYWFILLLLLISVFLEWFLLKFWRQY